MYRLYRGTLPTLQQLNKKQLNKKQLNKKQKTKNKKQKTKKTVKEPFFLNNN